MSLMTMVWFIGLKAHGYKIRILSGEIMEIKLNRTYTSHWDNWEYPIYKFMDGSYLCIAYSNNHGNYYLNRYTEEEFVEQGFKESEWEDYIFENIDPELIYI